MGAAPGGAVESASPTGRAAGRSPAAGLRGPAGREDRVAHHVEIGRDEAAEAADLRYRGQQVRHHDDRHAGGGGRAHAAVRILQREAEMRRHRQALGRAQERIGCRLARGIVAMGDDGVEARTVRVRQVYPAIENGRVVADLDAQSLEGEFVGARVRVLISAGEREAIVIPARYIQTRYGVDYVRLVRAQGALIDAPVQRGSAVPTEAMADGVEILSGLEPGDTIVPPEAGA